MPQTATVPRPPPGMREPVPTPDGTTERRHVDFDETIPAHFKERPPPVNAAPVRAPIPGQRASEFDDLPTDVQDSPLERPSDFDDDEEHVATVVRTDSAQLLRDVEELAKRGKANTPSDDDTRIDRPPRTNKR